MPDQIATLAAWTEPRPSARDVARFLAAWLQSVITRRPMSDLDLLTLWTGRLTLTPAEPQEGR